MSQQQQSETLCGAAALYVSGALSQGENSWFAGHLRGCGQCQSDLESCGGALADLADAAPVAASPQLRSRVLSQTGGQLPSVSSILLKENGLLALRVATLPWEKTPLAGISAKTLSVDAQRKYATSLVRMDPGTRYPSHRHAELEEAFVLEGDLTLHNVTLRAGDYCVSRSGSRHGESSTVNGCTLLVVTSQLDELVNDCV